MGIYDASSEEKRELIQREADLYLGDLTAFGKFYDFAMKDLGETEDGKKKDSAYNSGE